MGTLNRNTCVIIILFTSICWDWCFVTGNCLSHESSRCPENWYTVDNKTCLTVVPRHAHIYPSDQCRKLGARVPEITDVPGIKPCLQYLLQNSTVKVIRLNGRGVNFENLIVDHSSQYSLVCLQHEPAAPVITWFSVETHDNDPQSTKWRVDLLNSPLPYVTVKETNHTINITCRASGNPAPGVRIYRDNVPIEEFKPGTILIRYAGCNNSGVYTCNTSNLFGSSQTVKIIKFTRPVKIDSFRINNTKIGGDKIIPGDTISMMCSLTGCPSPDVLSITDDLNKTLFTESTSLFLHYNIDNVSCLHMGTYYCRADSLGGETADLRIYGCPVQPCRGEDKTKIISKNVNRIVSFHICVISENRPIWENRFKIWSANVQVGIEPRNGSRMYFLVYIDINLAEIDNSSTTIVISNGHGNLDYEIKFIHEHTPGEVQVEPIAGGIVGGMLVIGVVVIVIILYKKGFICKNEKGTSNNMQAISYHNQQGPHYQNLPPNLPGKDPSLYSPYTELLDDPANSPYEEVGQSLTNNPYDEISDSP